jgi:hypothetical protein
LRRSFAARELVEMRADNRMKIVFMLLFSPDFGNNGRERLK